jgi:two-component system cell cycle response regulator
MTARVLIVDDTPANVRLLRDKLQHEYFEVYVAEDGLAALEAVDRTPPDIILLDVNMPRMDGFECCERLKANPETAHIPVVMVTALNGREDRLKGLRAGADDFLSKPVDEFSLLARVRALTKVKLVADELRRREASGRRLGVIEAASVQERGTGGRILIVDDHEKQAARIAKALSEDHFPLTLQEAGGLGAAGGATVDAIVLSIAATGFDGLRLLAHFRSKEATREIPILAIADPNEESRNVRALDLGASDIVLRPVDPEELTARVRTQLRRKRYLEALRSRLDQSLELAVTDQLTGLHNRRYMASSLSQHVRRAEMGGPPVAVMIADVDFFKKINDLFGHDSGDAVLREFAARLATNVRPVDLACRYGGEEFVVIMPDTRIDLALSAAERFRRTVAGNPFRLPKGGESLNVTVSIGVAAFQGVGDTSETMLKRADEALYRAKASGRNRVETNQSGVDALAELLVG